MIAIAMSVSAAFLTAYSPEPETEMQFAVGTVPFRVPLPSGFCPANDALTKESEKLFAKSKSIMLATFVECGSAETRPWQDYTILTTPADSVQFSVSRKGFLANMVPEFDVPQYRDFIAKQVAGNAAATRDSPATIEIAGSSIPIGYDDVCVYLAGERPPRDGYPYSTRSGACMTSVGNRIVAIYRYADPRFGKSHATLLREARAIALSIRATDKP